MAMELMSGTTACGVETTWRPAWSDWCCLFAALGARAVRERDTAIDTSSSASSTHVVSNNNVDNNDDGGGHSPRPRRTSTRRRTSPHASPTTVIRLPRASFATVTSSGSHPHHDDDHDNNNNNNNIDDDPYVVERVAVLCCRRLRPPRTNIDNNNSNNDSTDASSSSSSVRPKVDELLGEWARDLAPNVAMLTTVFAAALRSQPLAMRHATAAVRLLVALLLDAALSVAHYAVASALDAIFDAASTPRHQHSLSREIALTVMHAPTSLKLIQALPQRTPRARRIVRHAALLLLDVISAHDLTTRTASTPTVAATPTSSDDDDDDDLDQQQLQHYRQWQQRLLRYDTTSLHAALENPIEKTIDCLQR